MRKNAHCRRKKVQATDSVMSIDLAIIDDEKPRQLKVIQNLK